MLFLARFHNSLVILRQTQPYGSFTDQFCFSDFLVANRQENLSWPLIHQWKTSYSSAMNDACFCQKERKRDLKSFFFDTFHTMHLWCRQDWSMGAGFGAVLQQGQAQNHTVWTCQKFFQDNQMFLMNSLALTAK